MNKFLFEYHMKMNGDTKISLSKALGIGRETLLKKVAKPEGGFIQIEIFAIAQRYRLTPQEVWDVFFADPIRSGREDCRQGVARLIEGRRHYAAKYRLPNGEAWSGHGHLPRTFTKYFAENGLTRDDLDRFLVDRSKK